MGAQEESEGSGAPEPGRPAELKQDELIEKLVPDPDTPPDVIMLVGFLGKTNRAGHVRLYLTPTLDEYLEISQKDVLHHQPVPPALNPLGGTLVWVRREAKLLHTQTASQQVQAQFLQGGITSRFLPQAGIGSISRGFNVRGWSTANCIFVTPGPGYPTVLGCDSIISCVMCPSVTEPFCG